MKRVLVVLVAALVLTLALMGAASASQLPIFVDSARVHTLQLPIWID
ncbi:MAG TPA: hypothetical protein VGK74_25275 [Symbiobacteriaceae bacterium]